jgi:hypothetical protein
MPVHLGTFEHVYFLSFVVVRQRDEGEEPPFFSFLTLPHRLDIARRRPGQEIDRGLQNEQTTADYFREI